MVYNKIKLNSIKLLRDKTGLSLSDCKKALEECNGDINNAINKLRIINLNKINDEENLDRSALDGLIAMHLSMDYGVLIQLNCETDFVAKNKKFMKLILNLVSIAYQKRCTNINELKSAHYKGSDTVQDIILSNRYLFNEKLELSKLSYLKINNGIIAGYVHGDLPKLGKSGALVSLQSLTNNKVKLQEIGTQVAMHIVAMKPKAISIEKLDQDKLNNELFIIKEQVKSLNKSKEITEKIINNKIARYYEEVVLLEQKFIKDDKMKISDFLKKNELNINSTIKLTDYKLLTL